MSDIEKDLKDLVASVEGQLEKVRSDAALDLAERLFGTLNLVHDSVIGPFVAAADGGLLTERNLADARDVLLAWQAARTHIEALLKTLHETAPSTS